MINRFFAIVRTFSRLEEARDVYQRVIEMDPRHFTALAFLGKVYHLLDDIDAAVVKYHEVSTSFKYIICH